MDITHKVVVKVIDPALWHAEVLEPVGIWEDNKLISQFVAEYQAGDVITAQFKLSGDNKKRQFIKIESLTRSGVQSGEALAPKEENWINDRFYINDETRLAFGAVQEMLQQPPNLLLTGASGYGKSEAAYMLAKNLGFSILDLSCGQMTEPTEWFGSIRLRGGETAYQPSAFVSAMEKGNVVILLDEINRTPPNITNTLLALLDHRREIKLMDYDYTVKVGENTIFVATINRGWQYTGTTTLDAALLNRFDIVLKFGAPPETAEVEIVLKNVSGIAKDIATKIVSVLRKIREDGMSNGLAIDVSTRSALKIANLTHVGKLSLLRAFNLCVVNSAEDEDIKPLQDLVNTELA